MSEESLKLKESLLLDELLMLGGRFGPLSGGYSGITISIEDTERQQKERWRGEWGKDIFSCLVLTALVTHGLTLS